MTPSAPESSRSSEPIVRFDADRHAYVDIVTGEELPSITQMLKRAKDHRGRPYVDDRWFTDDSSDRGTAVHRLTLEYDLEAIEDPATLTSAFKGYLLAYVALRAVVPCVWDCLEEPFLHEVLRFAGTPDRVGQVYGLHSVAELKSGELSDAHGIQLALQAILVARRYHLQPERLARWGFYLKADGRYRVHQFVDAHDFDRARKIIRECVAA